MASHSVFPPIHEFLNKIPYPGTPWQDVITQYPSYHHLNWVLFFSMLSASVQIFCWISAKIFAPITMGYTSTPSLPRKMKTSSTNYKSLGDAINYKSPINIASYSSSDLSRLSSKYCDGKLTEKEVKSFMKHCNKHHAEIQRNEKKYQECLFPIFTKAATLGFGVIAFYDKDWLYDKVLFYKGWPYRQGMECCAADLKLLYLAHIGWYVYKLFAQVYLDRKLKDFVASLIHHSATTALMSGSYSVGFLRIGIVTVLLHDPADIILQSAKLCRLVKQPMMTNLLFGSLVIVWFITRIVIFPYHCVLSGFYLNNAKPGGEYEFREEDIYVAHTITTILNPCMCALYILHLHWFYLIIKAVKRAISNKQVEDPRSETDDDSDDETSNNNN